MRYGTSGKTLWMLQNYIEAIRMHKRAVIFGRDYVVLSRPVYDALIKKVYPSEYERIEFSRDSNEWLKKEFTNDD